MCIAVNKQTNKSFVRMKGAKGEFGEFTLARGRRLDSYFAKRNTFMSVALC